jgi:dTDP-glucose 4,6-dehydratase/UDP-glucose 4,6-dehydratase
VKDVCTALEIILHQGVIGEIYNIGSDEEYSIHQVARLLIQLIHPKDSHTTWIDYIEDRPFNDKRYYISNIKMKQLGWNMTISFQEGIQALIKN